MKKLLSKWSTSTQMVAADLFASEMAKEMTKEIDGEIVKVMLTSIYTETQKKVGKQLVRHGFTLVDTYTIDKLPMATNLIYNMYPNFTQIVCDTPVVNLKQLIDDCDLTCSGIVVQGESAKLYVKHKQSDKVKLMLKIAGANQ